MGVEVMRMAKKKWYVRVHRGWDVDVEGTVTADSPYEAFLRFVRRKGVWPKRADAHMEHFPGGHTYWVYPAWRVGNATSLGDRYVARIVPVEEVQG
jgi:hypothetical protein